MLRRGIASFVRNSSKPWPCYLSSGALCNGILNSHFVPFIFSQAYYCSRSPHIPLGFVCRDRVRFELLSSNLFRTVFFLPPLHVMRTWSWITKTTECSPNSRSLWEQGICFMQTLTSYFSGLQRQGHFELTSICSWVERVRHYLLKISIK